LEVHFARDLLICQDPVCDLDKKTEIMPKVLASCLGVDTRSTACFAVTLESSAHTVRVTLGCVLDIVQVLCDIGKVPIYYESEHLIGLACDLDLVKNGIDTFADCNKACKGEGIDEAI